MQAHARSEEGEPEREEEAKEGGSQQKPAGTGTDSATAFRWSALISSPYTGFRLLTQVRSKCPLHSVCGKTRSFLMPGFGSYHAILQGQ